MNDSFDWDTSNESHILKHDLYPAEVEQAFYNRHLFTPAYNVGEEKREGLIGMTDTGRIITIFFTRRSGHIRVITAREATKREKRRYRR